MTIFFAQGSHSGILWTQKLRSPIENLELTSRFPRWVPAENKYVGQNVCHCALIDTWIFINIFLHWILSSGDPLWLTGCKFKKCAGAEDIQSVNSERDVNMTDSERDINMTDSERDINMTDSWWTASALNTADTEEYRQRMTHWTVSCVCVFRPHSTSQVL